MGSKRAWKGKHLFLYIACLVIIMLGIQGCTSFFEKKRQNKQNLANTKTAYKGNDKAPLEDIKEMLKLFPQYTKKWQGKQTLARAKALMLIGYFDSSLKNNEEVLRLYPQTLGDQALFQMGLNHAHPKNPNQDYQKAVKCFQSIINEYPESNIRDEAELWAMFLQEIVVKNEKIVSKNKEVTNKDEEINNLQHQIENLKYQIESLKDIDLGIEEKKRESLLK